MTRARRRQRRSFGLQAGDSKRRIRAHGRRFRPGECVGRGRRTSGTDVMYVRAFDGADWGNWSSFNLISTNTAPGGHRRRPQRGCELIDSNSELGFLFGC